MYVYFAVDDCLSSCFCLCFEVYFFMIIPLFILILWSTTFFLFWFYFFVDFITYDLYVVFFLLSFFFCFESLSFVHGAVNLLFCVWYFLFYNKRRSEQKKLFTTGDYTTCKYFLFMFFRKFYCVLILFEYYLFCLFVVINLCPPNVTGRSSSDDFMLDGDSSPA